MEDWIRDLIAQGTRSLREALTAIQQRIAAIYGMFTSFFLRLRSKFSGWLIRARQWKAAQLAHALAVYTTLRWLSLVFVPRELASLARSIRAWTLAEIGKGVAALRAEISAFRAWATGQINAARSAITALRAWALGEIGALGSDMRRLKDRVFGVLSTPERLAAWAVGAIAAALLRYLIAQSEAIAEYIWRRRTAVALRSLDFIERLVSRIL